MACSALDVILKDLLFCKLETTEMNSRELQELGRAVKNFTTKVSLCLGLGLLHRNEAKTLITLNDVRNKFAHKWNASFNDSEIQKKCEMLDIEFKDTLQKSEDDIAFDKFGYTASDLMRNLIARTSGFADEVEYAHTLQSLKIHREYIPMWSLT